MLAQDSFFRDATSTLGKELMAPLWLEPEPNHSYYVSCLAVLSDSSEEAEPFNDAIEAGHSMAKDGIQRARRF